MVAVMDGTVVGRMKLPIAGLMSDEPLEEVYRKLKSYMHSLQMLSLNFHAIFMTIGLLSLPVIPEIRITDRGLVDVLEGKIINPFIDYSG